MRGAQKFKPRRIINGGKTIMGGGEIANGTTSSRPNKTHNGFR
jgi:hypothetical protein